MFTDAHICWDNSQSCTKVKLSCAHHPCHLLWSQRDISVGSNTISQCQQITFRAWSSSTSLMDYTVPWLCMKFGKRTFSYACPATCNALPWQHCTVA